MKRSQKKSARKSAAQPTQQSPSITPETVAFAAMAEVSRLNEKVASMKNANFAIEFGDIKIVYSGPVTK